MSQGYRPGHIYTEADWNPMTFSEASIADGPTAYCASKGLAERAAWDWIKEHKPKFGLATICPPWIFGPNVAGIKNLSRLNESTETIWKLINGSTIPPTDFAGFADARDVAKAHLLAFEKPEAEGQRFIVGSHFDYQTAVDEIREEMPELRGRVPEGKPGAGKAEEVYQVDGSKVQRVLGLEYTPLRTTMKDTITQLVEAEKAAGQA
jgi:nucleoside-diphosphate-sugar epimerase